MKLKCVVKKAKDTVDSLYTQAYPNLKHAQDDCNDARIMLQRTYNVRDEDIVEIKNATEKVCSETYSQFSEKLQKSNGKRILVFHVFSGHGVLKDRN